MSPLIYSILEALVPIIFVVLLGWIAGRQQIMPDGSARALARFVITFALPINLFVAAVRADPRQILDPRSLIGLLVGFGGTFALGIILAYATGQRSREAAVRGLASSFPNMAYCGPPVLTAALGSSAVLTVVVGNLVTSLVVVPIALTLIARDAETTDGPAGFGAALWRAIRQPLVLLPIAGVILAIAKVKLPDIAVGAGDLVGHAAGGCSLFALGLILSAIPIKVDRDVIQNVAIKNVLQPALIFAAGYGLGLRGAALGQIFLLGVLPTATEVPAIATARDIYKEDAAETALVSALFAIISISVGMAIVSLIR